MMFIKIIALTGALFVGLPLLCGLCYVLGEFFKCLRIMTWDEQLGFMFQIGCTLLLLSAMGWVLFSTRDAKINATPSTNDTQQIQPEVENHNP